MSTEVLAKTPFKKLPVGDIKPKGWLYNQLRLQADGLTGHLDEIWEDVSSNSGWLGGNGERWERGPYYCDGLIPLAYIFHDERLIEKAKKWVEWSLKSQRDDGFFGPSDNDDWWPRMVMLKALIQYYEATGDRRIIKFMEKYFRYQLSHINDKPLYQWGRARGADNVYSVIWLYEKTQDLNLLDLAKTIMKQSIDWNGLFEDFPYKKPTGYYMNWSDTNNLTFDEIIKRYPEYHETHVVNVAMGVKFPAFNYLLTGDKKYIDTAKKGIETLMKYHGLVNGMFSGDEHINGNNPVQGTELCSVVEYMFSLENLIAISGDGEFADILEKVAFNALPAAISPDFTAHQYDQQVNQVVCSIAKRKWYNNGDDSNIFGLEPNFGCCTANMHQGWPKFVQNLWMGTYDNGLAAISYAPCEVNIKLKGQDIRLSVDTEYPFDEEIKIKIRCGKSIKFPIKLRIPEWCNCAQISINGDALDYRGKMWDKCSGFCNIDKVWHDGDVIKLLLPMSVKISSWYNNSVGVERGPLVYALKIGEKWNKINNKTTFADWEVYPTTPWNYGLIINGDEIESTFNVVKNTLDQIPFNPDNPPIKLICKGKIVPNWQYEYNSAGELPTSPVYSDEPIQDLVLIPYGCTNLRIAEFPEIAY